MDRRVLIVCPVHVGDRDSLGKNTSTNRSFLEGVHRDDSIVSNIVGRKLDVSP